jgi:hypothetical protein
MKRVIRTAIGVLLIVIGLVALVTPLTPGSWLVPIGLELLGLRLLIQRRLLSLLPTKARTKVEAWLNRLTQGRWFRRLAPGEKPDAKDTDKPA